MEFTFDNVNDAFRSLVTEIHSGIIPIEFEDSRNGNVLTFKDPVRIRYNRPTRRVLFNPARDCNPFFHLYESLWMLAGRNDVAPLKYYNSNMANYSDEDLTFNAAYGYRWRKQYGVDQLDELIEHLRQYPISRRAVLNIWSVIEDLLKIDTRNGLQSKDTACNISAVFRVSHGRLNMCVFNRSNDMVWGTLGANVVHFSMLQEYMANCLDLQVGVYDQISANLHIYEDKWNPDLWLSTYENRTNHDRPINYDQFPKVDHISLVRNKATFDEEIQSFVRVNYLCEDDALYAEAWKEPFLLYVAQPMCMAFHNHKRRNYEASLDWVKRVQNTDWREAGTVWIEKRKRNWETKNA